MTTANKEVKEDAGLMDYNNRIESLLTETTLRQRAGEIKPPAGRFMRKDTGEWTPLEHPGYTIITPPFEDEEEEDNVQTYETLRDVQQFILERLNPLQYAPAPEAPLHFTISDLVSGDTYKKRVDGPQEQSFLIALASCFDELNLRGAIKMNVLGVSLFLGGFVIALVGAYDEQSYKRLMLFRNAIYEAERLKNFGVLRKFKFTGHITLAYIESELSAKDRTRLAKTLVDVKERFFDNPLPLNVVRADVRKFDDMSRFYRCEGWPVFLFV